MATLADYIAIQDAGFTLSQNQERSFEFDFPSNVNLGTGDTRLVLTYMVDPSNSTNKDYDIDVNDDRVNSFTVSHSEPRTVTEVLSGLKFNVNNTIQFRVESGGGSITFSDVVLWYQRNFPNL